MANNPIKYEGWPGGVNNRIRETERGRDQRGRPLEFLRSAINVNFSAEGKPRRRQGYELVASGNYHSLWRDPALPWALVVKDSVLTLFYGDGPQEISLVSVDPFALMSYTFLNDFVYFSNGKDSGRVDLYGNALPWGMVVPAQPAVAVTSGLGLYEGCYHVSVSYIDVDGVEHGACEPVTVDVAVDGGLEVTLANTFPARAAYAEIFVSQANSETLYAAGQLTGPGTLSVGAASIGIGRPIETLYKEAPLPAQLICEFSGRLYMAVGNILFFTDPLRYELVTPEMNLFVFPTDITLLQPSHDGLYVGYESAVDFLQGTDPFDMRRGLASSYGAVFGTGMQIRGQHFDVPLDFIPVWWGQGVGFILGEPGGQVRLLTEDRLATQKFSAGTIITREHEGMTQLIGTLREPEGGAAKATDSVVAEVRKANVQ